MKTSVYLSPTIVRVAEGRGGANHASVRRCFTAELPETTAQPGGEQWAEALAATLAELWHNRRLARRDVSLALDMPSTLMKVLEAPPAPAKQIFTIVENELSSQLPEGAAYLYDYLVLDRRGVILATAAERRVIEACEAVFRSLGVTLERIDLALPAALRVFARIRPMQNRTYLAGVLDGASLLILLFENGKYSFSNVARLFEARNTPAAAVEIARQLSTMAQFHTARRTERELEAVLLAGLSEAELELCDSMANYLSLPVYPLTDAMAPLRKHGAAAQLPYCCSAYLTAIGGLFEK